MSLLNVTVKRAKYIGAQAPQLNTYVTLKLQNVKSTTVTVKGSEPCWEQDFLFETNNVNSGLLVEVWTKGMIWDRALGYQLIPLDTIPYCTEDTQGQWYPLDMDIILMDGEVASTKNPTGHMILLDCRFELPFDLECQTGDLQRKLEILNGMMTQDRRHRQAQYLGNSGYSEDSDYTSDLNYPVGENANSSASQYRNLCTPQRSLETSRENSYEKDDRSSYYDSYSCDNKQNMTSYSPTDYYYKDENDPLSYNSRPMNNINYNKSSYGQNASILRKRSLERQDTLYDEYGGSYSNDNMYHKGDDHCGFYDANSDNMSEDRQWDSGGRGTSMNKILPKVPIKHSSSMVDGIYHRGASLPATPPVTRKKTRLLPQPAGSKTQVTTSLPATPRMLPQPKSGRKIPTQYSSIITPSASVSSVISSYTVHAQTSAVTVINEDYNYAYHSTDSLNQTSTSEASSRRKNASLPTVPASKTPKIDQINRSNYNSLSFEYDVYAATTSSVTAVSSSSQNKEYFHDAINDDYYYDSNQLPTSVDGGLSSTSSSVKKSKKLPIAVTTGYGNLTTSSLTAMTPLSSTSAADKRIDIGTTASTLYSSSGAYDSMANRMSATSAGSNRLPQIPCVSTSAPATTSFSSSTYTTSLTGISLSGMTASSGKYTSSAVLTSAGYESNYGVSTPSTTVSKLNDYYSDYANLSMTSSTMPTFTSSPLTGNKDYEQYLYGNTTSSTSIMSPTTSSYTTPATSTTMPSYTDGYSYRMSNSTSHLEEGTKPTSTSTNLFGSFASGFKSTMSGLTGDSNITTPVTSNIAVTTSSTSLTSTASSYLGLMSKYLPHLSDSSNVTGTQVSTSNANNSDMGSANTTKTKPLTDTYDISNYSSKSYYNSSGDKESYGTGINDNYSIGTGANDSEYNYLGSYGTTTAALPQIPGATSTFSCTTKLMDTDSSNNDNSYSEYYNHDTLSDTFNKSFDSYSNAYSTSSTTVAAVTSSYATLKHDSKELTNDLYNLNNYSSYSNTTNLDMEQNDYNNTTYLDNDGSNLDSYKLSSRTAMILDSLGGLGDKHVPTSSLDDNLSSYSSMRLTQSNIATTLSSNIGSTLGLYTGQDHHRLDDDLEHELDLDHNSSRIHDYGLGGDSIHTDVDIDAEIDADADADDSLYNKYNSICDIADDNGIMDGGSNIHKYDDYSYNNESDYLATGDIIDRENYNNNYDIAGDLIHKQNNKQTIITSTTLYDYDNSVHSVDDNNYIYNDSVNEYNNDNSLLYCDNSSNSVMTGSVVQAQLPPVPKVLPVPLAMPVTVTVATTSAVPATTTPAATTKAQPQPTQSRSSNILSAATNLLSNKIIPSATGQNAANKTATSSSGVPGAFGKMLPSAVSGFKLPTISAPSILSSLMGGSSAAAAAAAAAASSATAASTSNATTTATATTLKQHQQMMSTSASTIYNQNGVDVTCSYLNDVNEMNSNTSQMYTSSMMSTSNDASSMNDNSMMYMGNECADMDNYYDPITSSSAMTAPINSIVGTGTGKKLPIPKVNGKSTMLMKQQTEIYDEEEDVGLHDEQLDEDQILNDSDQEDYYADHHGVKVKPGMENSQHDNYYHHMPNDTPYYDYRKDYFNEEDEYKYLEKEEEQQQRQQKQKAQKQPSQEESKTPQQQQQTQQQQQQQTPLSHTKQPTLEYIEESHDDYIDDNQMHDDQDYINDMPANKQIDDKRQKTMKTNGVANKNGVYHQQFHQESVDDPEGDYILDQQHQMSLKKQDSIIEEDEEQISSSSDLYLYKQKDQQQPPQKLSNDQLSLLGSRQTSIDLEIIPEEELKKKSLVRGETEEVTSGSMRRKPEITARQRWNWAYNKIIMQLNVSNSHNLYYSQLYSS